MELTLNRGPSHDDCTIGELFVDDAFLCYTLEDVVREIPGKPVEQWKIPGTTAIPAGRYAVVMTFSDRFQRIMPLLIDVPGFAGIRIHPGNTSEDTEGCILLGLQRTDNDVRQSREACDDLYPQIATAILTKETVFLTINPTVGGTA